MPKSNKQTKNLKDICEKLLRENGFKATPSRRDILRVLLEAVEPLCVDDIKSRLYESMNITTLYRALESFHKKGILYQTHFREGKAYYEYQEGHYHHIVCGSCGIKERVHVCVSSLMPTIKKNSKKFSDVTDHILEFFGVCNTCK